MDERAYKTIFQLKGAAGTKPCLNCKNIVSNQDLMDADPERYLKHFAIATPNGFDLHTEESFAEMVDVLNASHANMTKTNFKTLQQALGLNFVPGSLCWDK